MLAHRSVNPKNLNPKIGRELEKEMKDNKRSSRQVISYTILNPWDIMNKTEKKETVPRMNRLLVGRSLEREVNKIMTAR